MWPGSLGHARWVKPRWPAPLQKTGSAALDLMRQSSETLAGRVAYIDMAPLSVGEAAAAGIADNTLWLRGGFPDSLLELETLNDLLGHPVCGLSFEGHCIENLVQAAGQRRVPYFYRTQVGAEIDLVLEQGGKPEIAIEVKRSMAPSPEKGFAIACDDLQISQRYVVYPGQERIPLRHGALAMGLQELVSVLSQD